MHGLNLAVSEGIILGIKDAVKIGGLLPVYYWNIYWNFAWTRSRCDWVAYGHGVSHRKIMVVGRGIFGALLLRRRNNDQRWRPYSAVAFGIPGSLGTAILLGALLMVGLLPGPDMLTTELHITFSMVGPLFLQIFWLSLLMIGQIK